PAAEAASPHSGGSYGYVINQALAPGARLVTLHPSKDGTGPPEFAVRDVATGAVLRRFGPGRATTYHPPTLPYLNPGSGLALNPDGTRLAAAVDPGGQGQTRRLEVWDLCTGTRLLDLDLGDEILGGNPGPYSVTPSNWAADGSSLVLPMDPKDVSS